MLTILYQQPIKNQYKTQTKTVKFQSLETAGCGLCGLNQLGCGHTEHHSSWNVVPMLSKWVSMDLESSVGLFVPP